MTLLLWAVPTAVLVAVYLVANPMMILRVKPQELHDRHQPNKGVLTVNNFLINNPTAHFDSFILGSSLSINYHAADWAHYLPEGSRPYHFDMSMMTFEQIDRSLLWLSRHAPVRNVLIVCSPLTLTFDSLENIDGVALPTPPALEPSALKRAKTHWKFFAEWYSMDNLAGWVYANIPGTDHKDLLGNQFALLPADYRADINEECVPARDVVLDSLAADYERQHPEYAQTPAAYELADSVRRTVLSPRRIAVLRHIAHTLDSLGTDYRLVLAADKNRVRVAAADTVTLRRVFGANFVNLADSLTEITRNPYNYYDENHYRPRAARVILSKIYANKITN